MNLNKEKAYDIFRVNFSEEEQKQTIEINKIKEDFSLRNNTRSGMYVKAHADIYEKHLKVKIDSLINAFLESFRENEIIDSETENELTKEISKFVDTQYGFKSNSLTQLIISAGLNNSGISAIQLTTLQSRFNMIKSIKGKHIKRLIEKHNQNAIQIKKLNSFWNTKNGMITAIGTIIIAMTGVIVLFVNSGNVNKNNDNIIIPNITKFEIIPSQIKLGNSAKLIWDVSNSDSVVFNNKVGLVPFVGSQIVYPLKTTSYKLSVYRANIELSISQKIIVIDSLNNVIR